MTLAAPRIKQTHDGTILNIQGLRGVAAILVVWSHMKYPIAKLCPQKLVPFFATDLGGIGVDVFFIISGFVICMTAARRHTGPVDFLLARLARVAPLYLTATLLIIFFKTAAADPMPFNSIWNGIFYFPVFDHLYYSSPPLEIGWTLSFEMWFYTMFGLLLTLMPPRWAALALPLLFASGVLAFIWYRGDWYLPRFLFHPFVLEFSFGCVIYHLRLAITPALSLTFLLVSLAFFLFVSAKVAYLGLHNREMGPEINLAWLRLVLWGLPAALLTAGLLGLELHGAWMMPAGLVWLGEISYSLYLSHRLPEMLIGKYGHFLHLRNPYAIGVFMLAVSILAGWLCFTLVEKPLTSGARTLAKFYLPPAKGVKPVAKS